jgi:hypothetical protein
MTPSRELPRETLERQADEAGRLLREARRMLKELAHEKQVVLIRDEKRAARGSES